MRQEICCKRLLNNSAKVDTEMRRIQMCMVLPSVIERAVKDFEGTIVPHDTVIDELREMVAYMLGFGNYKGF